MPDGRKFWVDAPVAREITGRVAGVLENADRRLTLVSGLASVAVTAMGDRDRRRLLDLIVSVANETGHEREAERVLSRRLELGP